jgi:CubicO group peptidase (beta-lactamase class C family)
VNGELVVWQFGASPVSSSFMMSLPARRLTMILLANSSGLVEPFVLAPGDVTASPFARVFLGLVSP